MTQFNKAEKAIIAQDFSANGNLQDVKSTEQQFYELVVNTLYGRDSFYESTDDKAARLGALVATLVARGKYDFVANMLLFARTEMNIRNMPILGTVEFTKALRDRKAHYPKLRSLISDVTRRVDQITDMLALTISKLGGKAKMPMSLKRGLSDAFNKFDEYQFAKYNRDGKITLKDALRIVHPTPKSAVKSDLFNKIMTDGLQTPDTWEVELSANGQKSEAERKSKKEVWEGLIDRNSLGYQATLKNLRNILESGVSQSHIEKISAYLVENVCKSKSLPFEFWTAYQAIAPFNNQTLKTAISKAMDYSVQNVPKLGDKVWVIVDTSGSMSGRAADTACFFAAVIAKAHENCQNFALTMFDSNARNVDLELNNSILGNFQYLSRLVGGGSTNFEAALNMEKTLGFNPDIVFVLTDNEINRFGDNYGWGSNNSDTAVKKAAPGALKFVINMESSTTTPLPERLGWHALAGWSEKIFDYIAALKKGTNIIKLMSVPYPYSK